MSGVDYCVLVFLFVVGLFVLRGSVFSDFWSKGDLR